jgi:hypothetical protein
MAAGGDRLTIRTGAILVALLFGCACATPVPTIVRTPTPLPPGVLVPEAPAINLGNVPVNVQQEAEFDLVNSGGQPVTILGLPHVTILEGCCPVNPTVSSTVIPPKGTVALRYPFLMHTGAPGGPQRIQITLMTDSPQTPTITLLLVLVAGT